MTKRTTIGENPLDAIIPVGDMSSPAKQKFDSNRITRNDDPPKPLKNRLTVHITQTTIDRAKNAVFWTPGLTLAELAETSFSEAVDELEKLRGEPFPQRKSSLKGGRPIK